MNRFRRMNEPWHSSFLRRTIRHLWTQELKGRIISMLTGSYTATWTYAQNPRNTWINTSRCSHPWSWIGYPYLRVFYTPQVGNMSRWLYSTGRISATTPIARRPLLCLTLSTPCLWHQGRKVIRSINLKYSPLSPNQLLWTSAIRNHRNPTRVYGPDWALCLPVSQTLGRHKDLVSDPRSYQESKLLLPCTWILAFSSVACQWMWYHVANFILLFPGFY